MARTGLSDQLGVPLLGVSESGGDQVAPRSVDLVKRTPGVKPSIQATYTAPSLATSTCGSCCGFLVAGMKRSGSQVAPPLRERRKIIAGSGQPLHGFGPV